MLIYSYIHTRENWKNSKFCENTPPCGRRVSTQFVVFPISTRVDITVYQHGKCFIFLKCKSAIFILSSITYLNYRRPSIISACLYPNENFSYAERFCLTSAFTVACLIFFSYFSCHDPKHINVAHVCLITTPKLYIVV